MILISFSYTSPISYVTIKQILSFFDVNESINNFTILDDCSSIENLVIFFKITLNDITPIYSFSSYTHSYIFSCKCNYTKSSSNLSNNFGNISPTHTFRASISLSVKILFNMSIICPFIIILPICLLTIEISRPLVTFDIVGWVAFPSYRIYVSSLLSNDWRFGCTRSKSYKIYANGSFAKEFKLFKHSTVILKISSKSFSPMFFYLSKMILRL